MSLQVKFACPHCNQHIKAPLEMCGMTVVCPSCNERIQVPQSGPVAIPQPLPPPPARLRRKRPQITIIATTAILLLIAGFWWRQTFTGGGLVGDAKVPVNLPVGETQIAPSPERDAVNEEEPEPPRQEPLPTTLKAGDLFLVYFGTAEGPRQAVAFTVTETNLTNLPLLLNEGSTVGSQTNKDAALANGVAWESNIDNIKQVGIFNDGKLVMDDVEPGSFKKMTRSFVGQGYQTYISGTLSYSTVTVTTYDNKKKVVPLAVPSLTSVTAVTSIAKGFDVLGAAIRINEDGEFYAPSILLALQEGQNGKYKVDRADVPAIHHGKPRGIVWTSESLAYGKAEGLDGDYLTTNDEEGEKAAGMGTGHLEMAMNTFDFDKAAKSPRGGSPYVYTGALVDNNFGVGSRIYFGPSVVLLKNEFHALGGTGDGFSGGGLKFGRNDEVKALSSKLSRKTYWRTNVMIDADKIYSAQGKGWVKEAKQGGKWTLSEANTEREQEVSINSIKEGGSFSRSKTKNFVEVGGRSISVNQHKFSAFLHPRFPQP